VSACQDRYSESAANRRAGNRAVGHRRPLCFLQVFVVTVRVIAGNHLDVVGRNTEAFQIAGRGLGPGKM
jgi:hypothetical protein